MCVQVGQTLHIVAYEMNKPQVRSRGTAPAVFVVRTARIVRMMRKKFGNQKRNTYICGRFLEIEN